MTLYPDGYGTRLISFEQMVAKHGPKAHPEFARRLFAWLESQGGRIGIGTGHRTSQPVGPTFAPPGLSFHGSVTFASGVVGYAAVDLVVAVPGGVHRAPTWAETADAPEWGLHTFIRKPQEPWHMQCVEMRGFGTWLADGRPDPSRRTLPGDPVIPPPPPPPPIVLEDPDMVPTCFVTDTRVRGVFALVGGRWVPWLFAVPKGAPHWTGDHELTREQILSDQGAAGAALWRKRGGL